jgi:Beta-galactosidase
MADLNPTQSRNKRRGHFRAAHASLLAAPTVPVKRRPEAIPATETGCAIHAPTEIGVLGAVVAFRGQIRCPAKVAALLLGFASPVTGPAAADELVLPNVLERNQSAEIVYRLDGPATGHGFLDIEWSDVDGRLVERRRIPFDLAGADELVFQLDLSRAVTMKNRLAAHLSFDGVDQSGKTAHRENDEATSFIASPSDHPWSDYQIIMWQARTRNGYATLRRLGITAGMVEADHREETRTYVADMVEPLLANDLRWFLENIATDFYSPYHKWSGDRPVNWRFLEAKERFRQNPLDLEAFVREPSLSDPDWLDKVHDRLIRDVRSLQPYRPLYYDLGDEAGIADLSVFWDFDFSEASLTAMRVWLRERYGSLTSLNQEWGSEFSRWEQVMPMTTREAMERSDQNFSAWADFKEWMDIAFAHALQSGTKAIHAAAPDAVAAIEGAQIPGWGGYDYFRLAASVDAMELYDYGDNVELVRSFKPEMLMLTTSFDRGPSEAHRIWRELLRGTRGIVLWDEKNEFVDENGNVGERGREAAPYFAELRGGLGALLINNRRHTDPIAVLYSPASMRVQWMLDRKASGEDWTRRSASTEYQDDAIRTATRNFARLIEHSGLQHRFVSSEEVRRGDLRRGDYRILMLPQTIALSTLEAKEIRDFVEQGGLVIASSEPGIFNEHGRRMAQPLLRDVFAGPATRATMRFAFGRGKAIYWNFVDAHGRENAHVLAEILETAGVRPRFPLIRADGRPESDVETYIFENGGVTIVALLRDYAAPSIAAGPETVVLALPQPLNAYDLRTGRSLGSNDRITVELGPVEPVLLAVSENLFASPSVSGPQSARLGTNAEFSIRSGSPAALDVLRVEIIDPNGSMVERYSGNIIGSGRPVVKLVPFALNDKAGTWTIRVKDRLGSEPVTATLKVEP